MPSPVASLPAPCQVDQIDLAPGTLRELRQLVREQERAWEAAGITCDSAPWRRIKACLGISDRRSKPAFTGRELAAAAASLTRPKST